MQLNIFSKLIITALSGVVLLSSCQKSFDKKLAADYYTGSVDNSSVYWYRRCQP